MPGRRVSGVHRVPGDKSITHRALMLAALAPGRSSITGGLTSLDARSTASVLRHLGASISPLRQGTTVSVDGLRQLTPPSRSLDCGNSGTTARLILGILAAQPFTARLTGDSSLRRRPMARVTAPLTAMGARFAEGPGSTLPLSITGGALCEVHWELPVASAQVKSAVLLAAAVGGVAVTIVEPAVSRDHTERMLGAAGFEIGRSGTAIRLEPSGRFEPIRHDVPGDPSSAIFLIAAAILAGAGAVAIEGVGLNPTRTAAFDVLRRMQAELAVDVESIQGGEPVGTVTARAGELSGCDVAADEIPRLIDEIPMLACLAARAQGTTRFRDVAELRVKESDRLQLIAANLRAIGAVATIEGDDLVVEGHRRPLGGRVITGGDHRIAMAFASLGTEARNRIEIDDLECAAVSFPGFEQALHQIFAGRAA